MKQRSCAGILLIVFLSLPLISVAEDYPLAFGIRFGTPISEIFKAYEKIDRYHYLSFSGDVSGGNYTVGTTILLKQIKGKEVKGATSVGYSVFNEKIYEIRLAYEKCLPSQPEVCDLRHKKLVKSLSGKYGRSSIILDYERDRLNKWKPRNLHRWKSSNGLIFSLFKAGNLDVFRVFLICSHEELLDEYIRYQK